MLLELPGGAVYFREVEHGTEEYRRTVELRDRILRSPLGLDFSEEELAAEAADSHLAGFLQDEVLSACLVLSWDSEPKAKMRQVAVEPHCQGQGIGKALILFAEQSVRARGLDFIYCNARLPVVPFYECLDYNTVGDKFSEVGIDHVRMEKTPHPFGCFLKKSQVVSQVSMS